MESFSFRERAAALERMEARGVDVLVIGGGITGAAVAMDAAVRGYRVGLVEKSDFAGATSSKSTKLVHGGIRYLPQYDFALVHEALVERGLLFRNAPWIVRPLAFVLPLYGWNKRPLGSPFVPPFGVGIDLVVESGLMLYDAFAGRLNVHKHSRLALDEALRRAPAIKSDDLKHAFVYYDGETDDTRLTMAVLRTAVRHGALAANYAEATSFDIEGSTLRAVHVRDQRSGADYRIAARHVVNAGGIFAERIEALTGQPSTISVEPAKGVHLIFSRETLPMTDDAVVLPETDDDRLLFLVPWEDRVLVGTTDTEGGDIDRPSADDDDVSYLLEQCNRYLRAPLTQDRIVSTYAGYRPLVKSKADSSARLSRSHAVVDGPAGMISIVGGKLTTWRKMAEDAVNRIAEREGKPASDLTKQVMLEGTSGWPVDETLRSFLGRPIRDHLDAFYGADQVAVLSLAEEDPSGALAQRIAPDLPYLMAEVVYAVRNEMAMTLDDVMARRTRLVLEDRSQGLTTAESIAAVMSRELGWDDGEMSSQIEEYRQKVRDEYQQQHASKTTGAS